VFIFVLKYREPAIRRWSNVQAKTVHTTFSYLPIRRALITLFDYEDFCEVATQACSQTTVRGAQTSSERGGAVTRQIILVFRARGPPFPGEGVTYHSCGRAPGPAAKPRR